MKIKLGHNNLSTQDKLLDFDPKIKQVLYPAIIGSALIFYGIKNISQRNFRVAVLTMSAGIASLTYSVYAANLARL